MEDNKKFKLNDEMLDNVAGGAGGGMAVTDEAYAGCPFPHDSTVVVQRGSSAKNVTVHHTKAFMRVDATPPKSSTAT